MKKLYTLLLLVALLSGCSSDYQILESITPPILTADSSTATIGETITFTAKNVDGADITASSEFTVNGTAITGNTFTSQEEGSFEVLASFQTVKSDPLVVTFDDGSQINFKKRVLIEDYTGTWCGFCPRVAHAIELTMAQTDAAVPVAIHRPSSNPSDGNYDPYNYDTSELEATLAAAGYPKGYLNRTLRWTFPEPNNIAQAIALTQGENPKLGLALTPIVSGNNINLNVNVKFSKDFTGVKLVVYVLENGLLYEQHNYTDYYGGVDVIEDYHHNHVLRSILTPQLGEAISATDTTSGRTFTKSFNIYVPSNVANMANLEFVAFVLDASGKVINVRKAASGDTQDFEEL